MSVQNGVPIYLTIDEIVQWVSVLPPTANRIDQGITNVIPIHHLGTMNVCVNVMAIHPIARYRYFSMKHSGGEANLHCHP